MNDDAIELEREAIELVLHIDALGAGKGGEAFKAYQQVLSRAVRPLLERQKAALMRQIDAEDTRAAETGRPWLSVATDPDLAASGMCAVQETLAHEAGLVAEWKALIETLNALGREATRQEEP